MARSPRTPDASTPVQFLSGVGPVRAQQLKRLGIETVGDLLHHYPADYRYRGEEKELSALAVGDRAVTRGRLLDVQTRKSRRGRSFVVAVVGEGRGRLTLTWFNAPYMAERLRIGREVVVAGEVTSYRGRLQMVNPEIESNDAEEGGSELSAARPLPRYPLTAGLRQASVRRLVRNAVEALADTVKDPLAPAQRERLDLLERSAALRAIHDPDDLEAARRARERLAFDEALALQLAVGVRRSRLLRRPAAVRLEEYGELSREYVRGLGFDLTSAQRRVLREIAADMKSETAMHRLVQGDVGSGKTVVAVIAMLWGVEAGGQSAFMAPTEVLARQHGKRQIPRLRELGVEAAVLTSSTPSAQRREILAGLASGRLQCIFGTHALIQEGVEFRRLALAIVDEQHRFGVLQRAALAEDGAHLLVMSATPIPRSLAMTVYGDLDLGIIDERPPGRSPVQTEVMRRRDEAKIHADVVERAQRGEQTFYVFPLVEESEVSDLESAEGAYERLRNGPLKGLRVGLLHGRMKAQEKDEIADVFGRGELDVLVATTVIEVGIDIPDASMMVVFHAERFGLSQLHQLRGRVGRSAVRSRCVLVPSDDASPPSVQRLRDLAAENDGFKVAELDLRERGMGDLQGVRQHGELPFSLLNPLRDAALVESAREFARAVLDADPRLEAAENAGLAEWLEEMGQRNPVWSKAG